VAVYFTDNVRDLSNTEGYQFEFYCERCGNGYRSPYRRDRLDQGKDLIHSIGYMLGGRMAQVGSAIGWLDRSTNSKAKDAALREAVETIKHNFVQCRGCSDWVCHEVCWNDQIGQCHRCSPSVAEELSRAQAAAQVQQLQDRAREVDWTSGIDVAARNPVACPSCSARVAPGRFCSSCGAAMSPNTRCTGCGTNLPPGARFCSNCGTSAW
jgi:hypothetical protein